MTKLQSKWMDGLFVCLGNNNKFWGENSAELNLEQLLTVMSALSAGGSSAGGSSVIRFGCFPRLTLGNVSTVTH